METLDEFRQQVFEVRDRYYDDMKDTFLQNYQDAGTCFEFSILYQPEHSHHVELAVDKFKKAIGGLGYKVVDIHDYSGSARRFRIERVAVIKIKSSKCIIS
jgi:hypothetical protein